MNINSELEKLISHRDVGNLTQAEFEKAKTLLLSGDRPEIPLPKKSGSDVGAASTGIPGLGLAAGVFVGNLLVITIASGNIIKGFVIGAIAAVLVVVFSIAARAFRSQ